MNILTFDIEEWYLEAASHGGRAARYQVFDSYLDSILNLLEQEGKKATFFCLGRIASDFPEVVKKIAAKGHEIGCHSDKHLWITKMTPEEFMGDTRSAIDALEQCIGTKVLSYRAPAFSIGRANDWAFDILAECGIERDASVFPAARDFGGFPDFGTDQPCIVGRDGVLIKEFPIVLASLLGRQVAFSGGGYFRFFPLPYVLNQMQHRDYSMTYFHISDLLSETKALMSREDYESYFREKGTLVNRYKRYIKSNLGTSGAYAKLTKLIQSVDFVNLSEADRMIDWEATPPKRY